MVGLGSRCIIPHAELHFNATAEQTMGMPAIKRHWTADEVRALQDESRPWPRYELIEGELLVTPSPGAVHQIAVGAILVLLDPYVTQEDIGIALPSPADLELQPGGITQPDVFVVPLIESRQTDRLGTWADVKRLLLAIEVISPSSVHTDRVKKRRYYLAAGVPEYWVVDLDARTLERWTLGEDAPTTLRSMFEWRPAGASVQLVIDLASMFDRIWTRRRRMPF